MGRANATVIGSVVLASLIVGFEGYALFRPHHRSNAPEMADLQVAPPTASLPAAPPAPEPPPPTQAETAPEIVPVPTETPDPTPDEHQPEVVFHHRDLVRQADEKVFDALGLPDAQRAAIRAIDDQYVRTVQLIESPDLDATVDLTANQTRRTAIGSILGPDSMRAFISRERKAERRVRNELRAQMLHGQ